MSPGRHLLVAGICSVAGLVDVATLATVAPRWWRPPTAETRVLEGVSLDVDEPEPSPTTPVEDARAPEPSLAAQEPTHAEPTEVAPRRTDVGSSLVAQPSSAAPSVHAQEPTPTAPGSSGPSRDGAARSSPLVVITFASEAVELSAEARTTLARVAATLGRGAVVRVEGHADPSGRVDGNEYFARARARVVARELERLGVPRGAMELVGRGASEPLDRARTPAARARNRRVELWQVGP